MPSNDSADLADAVGVHGVTRESLESLTTPRFFADLAGTANTELLSVYAVQVDPHWRAVAALHQDTPQHLLKRLAKDSHKVVRALARSRLGWQPHGSSSVSAVESEQATQVKAGLHTSTELRPSTSEGIVQVRPVSREVPTDEVTWFRPEPRPNAAPAAKSQLSPESRDGAGGTGERLTEEQEAVLASPPTENLIVAAYAGTGKTSTLVRYAEAWSTKMGLYLAFNSAIKEEAHAKFPRNVKVMTMHGLAHREVGIRDIEGGLQNGNLQRRFIRDAAKRVLRTDHVSVDLVRLVSLALRRYLIGNEREVLDHHIGPMGPSVEAKPAEVLHLARLVIHELMDFARGDRPFTHDMYLKRYALIEQRPLPFDYVMVDEAQDLNPVMIGIVERFGLPLVVVGDRYQSIYAFRGAVSAMTTFQGRTTPLTLSWRFGEHLATASNRVLSLVGEPPSLPVRGSAARETRLEAGVGAEGLVLARSNARLFEYLLSVRERFFIAGGFTAFAAEILAAADLFEGRQPDTYSSLPYREWDEVLEAADDGDATAGRIVKLLNTYEPRALRDLLRKLKEHAVAKPHQARVHLSTAHKAKGLEHETVTLLDDFQSLSDRTRWREAKMRQKAWSPTLQKAFDQEVHLLYVAITRAKRALFLPDELHAELTA